MYHLTIDTMPDLSKPLLVLAACFSLFLPAAAQETNVISSPVKNNPALEGFVESTASDYPILRRQDKLRKKPLQVQLFQIDREAIGDRQPLLLVHGLRGEYWRDFRWDKVIGRLITYPDFCRQYKIYSLRYDSLDLIANLLPQFKQAVVDLHHQTGGKPVTILALSLGGSLTRAAMADPEFDKAVRLVFTLGTPFHGSPMFSRDWLMYSVYKNMLTPWTRVDRSLAFHFYFKLNPSLLADLNWDNCDRFMPEAGTFRSRLPLGPGGNLQISTNANARTLELNRSSKIDKSKFIAYAGYMLNPYMKPGLSRHFEATVLYPYSLITTKLPAHIAREHPVLDMLNREIARIIPDDQQSAAASSRFVYALNDGITPVNSAVFLPSDDCSAAIAREQDLDRLKPNIDVRLARVFRNIDHLTFIDGYRPRHASPMIKDQLNPADGPRTMFDWILSDLMQSQAPPGQLATESKPSLEIQRK